MRLRLNKVARGVSTAEHARSQFSMRVGGQPSPRARRHLSPPAECCRGSLQWMGSPTTKTQLRVLRPCCNLRLGPARKSEYQGRRRAAQRARSVSSHIKSPCPLSGRKSRAAIRSTSFPPTPCLCSHLGQLCLGVTAQPPPPEICHRRSSRQSKIDSCQPCGSRLVQSFLKV